MLSVHRAGEGFPTGGWETKEIFDLRVAAEAATRGVWSPIVWMGCYRHESNFSVCAWAVLDIDDGLPKAKAAELMKGVRFAILPTKSDGIVKGTKPPCDRYRLIAPFEQPITVLDIYRHNMKQLALRFQADTQATDGARCWQKSKCVEVISETGAALPVIWEVPEQETSSFKNEQFKAYTERHKNAGVFPRRVQDFLLGNVSEGSRNKELFFCACVLFNYGYDFPKVLEIVEAIPGMTEVGVFSTLRSAAKRCGVSEV